MLNILVELVYPVAPSLLLCGGFGFVYAILYHVI